MRTASRPWIVALCWLTVLFEGFDIVALGATIPILTHPEHGHLGVTVADMTFVSTISLVGVGAGAALIGPIADRFGRRTPLMICVAVFSVFTLIFPLMPNVALMGIARLIAGLGLGACMPVAVTIMQESAPGGRKANASTVTMTGYHAGAVLASLAALLFHQHWQWLFYLGGVIGLLALIPMGLKLPETTGVAPSDAKKVESSRSYTAGDLFRNGRARITIGLWISAFMGLLLVYGMNTWLPKIMEAAGYNVSSSLVMLFVLNIGAIIGLLVGGNLADSKGVKGTTMVWFAAAAVLLAVLSIKMSSVLLLNTAILVTGVFVFSGQVLVYGFVGYLYPKALVATGMGFTSGVGRLGAIVGPWISGALVSAGLAYPGGFYLFAIVAVVGFVAVALIPKPAATTAAQLTELEDATK
jgi:AAHS family benzoate transporter-like MFS transporter